MKVLFCTPVEVGSGESVTAFHMAEMITASGGSVFFLASATARIFLEGTFQQNIRELSNDGDQNHILWETSIREFRPDLVIFADFPLLYFSCGTTPFSDMGKFVRSMEAMNACFVTLDHTGFAQQGKGMFFGPPHLSFHYEKWPPIPEWMHILLPCPMNEPLPLAWRKGQPFRYWNVPLTSGNRQRRGVRQRYLAHEDDLLIFYPIPNWSWQIAQSHGLPHYLFLPEILEYYLADLPRPVTVISVNNGNLLKQHSSSKIRIINVPSLPASEYEVLLFAADLMMTDNKISISMGKAICGFVPCVVWNNSFRYRDLLQRAKGKLRQILVAMETIRPGAVYPYELFPNGIEEVQEVGIYRDNSITKGFVELEIFGGEKTRHEIRALLTDQTARDSLREKQHSYVNKVRKLDTPSEILLSLPKQEKGT